ncbi:MAG: ABC transporter substrate-binding protein [Clostridia bacterium]|nr:ABC transporter substrate-binding protein [Clostridia bacterium]
MKKLFTLILAALTAMTCVLFVGCGKDSSVTVSVYAPDGAPALAIAKFINDNETFGTTRKFEYNVVSASEIKNAMLVKGADIVILPLNDATKIYKDQANGIDDYVMAAVITHGNLYVMSQADITSVSDLVGKVILVPNRGQVPDWTLKFAIENSGLEFEESETAVEGKVALKYPVGGASAIPALLKTDATAIGLLPEPAATAVNVSSANAVGYKLNLQELYSNAEKSYPQAVMMVKRSTVETNAELMGKIGAAIEGAVAWATENPTDAVNAIKTKYESSTLNPAMLKPATIENCKIYWQSAQSAKGAVLNYINNIRIVDENAAATVDNDFFLK